MQKWMSNLFIEQVKFKRLYTSGTVVEHSTHIPKIVSSNPALGTREEMAGMEVNWTSSKPSPAASIPWTKLS
jgi:hypothetical protein